MSTPHVHIADTDTDPGPAVISLVGDHDLVTVPDVELAVRRALDAGDGVIVDLTDATFIDSAILRTPLNAHVIAHTFRIEGVAVVAPPTSPAAQLLDLVGAAQMLTVYRTLEAARGGDPRPPIN